jgi:hypothetical protein
MNRSLKLILVGLLLIAATSSTVVLAESDDRYFPETGHYVSGDFLLFYNQAPNARTIYGLPITEQYYDININRTVQYFQNARFELYPEYPPGEKVLLTQLGTALHNNGRIVEIIPTAAYCQQEEEWIFPVCFAFLDFYQEHDGALHFGKPISGIEHYRGRLIQQFEFAHFVWVPENPSGAKVTLAPLGMQFFHRIGENPALLYPEEIKPIYNSHITDLQVRVFTQQAIVAQGGSQTVNVVVKDQNNFPTGAALVLIKIEYPDGNEETIGRIPTNSFGIAQSAFTVNSDQIGVVEISVTVTYNNLVSYGVTTFRLWY